MSYGVRHVVKDALTGNLRILPKEESAKRLAICEACPYYAASKKCNKCGCYMPVKTTLRKATCPIRKW